MGPLLAVRPGEASFLVDSSLYMSTCLVSCFSPEWALPRPKVKAPFEAGQEWLCFRAIPLWYLSIDRWSCGYQGMLPSPKIIPAQHFTIGCGVQFVQPAFPDNLWPFGFAD